MLRRKKDPLKNMEETEEMEKKTKRSGENQRKIQISSKLLINDDINRTFNKGQVEDDNEIL